MRLRCFVVVPIISKFQSTHPCGVRRRKSCSLTSWCSFNPRTRVGCDRKMSDDEWYRQVSIHAPVWGATLVVCFISDKCYVSIHAPVWGATSKKRIKNLKTRVSIHAPVWGATISNNPDKFTLGFNPRTRVGCDGSSFFGDKDVGVSIHAPVWGATYLL